ncbi:MAG: type 2 isopentenyl-diphosphate Delta-isomerase [Balneolaceae bacterium]
MSIKKRKTDHIELCTEEDVFYRKSTGFERYDFIHNALPEVNPEQVSTRASLLGREFYFPLFISSMTGGHPEAESINSMIARFCQKVNLPFGVGSQRVMLENPAEIKSFSVVRKNAPDAFIAANIGGSQITGGLTAEKLARMVDSIRADAVIVHLNPLQELVQPEGDHHFEGIEEGIAGLVKSTGLPVIVKETGAGISRDAAMRLLEKGVKVIDTSGAGGTSWSRVENLRIKGSTGNEERETEYDPFEDWGIPTSVCIEDIQKLRTSYAFELIASGGMRTSFDMAKALALGADFTAVAQPVIMALKSGGIKELETMVETWRRQLQTILVLLGCQVPGDLDSTHLRKV